MKTLFTALALTAALALSHAALATDYAVTAASVVPSANASLSRGTAGVAITAGQAVSIPQDKTVQLYDANSGTSQLRNFVGIACNSAALGQPIVYCSSDPAFTPGFTVAAGAIVIGSATAGGLCPAADNTIGNYLTVVGLGIGANKINLAPFAAGVVTP